MLVCASLCAHCTRDRGCSAHPAFPAPSVFEEGQDLLQASGAIRREKVVACLFRSWKLNGSYCHVIASAAKQSVPSSPRDGLLRFARNDGLMHNSSKPLAEEFRIL